MHRPKGLFDYFLVQTTRKRGSLERGGVARLWGTACRRFEWVLNPRSGDTGVALEDVPSDPTFVDFGSPQTIPGMCDIGGQSPTSGFWTPCAAGTKFRFAAKSECEALAAHFPSDSWNWRKRILPPASPAINLSSLNEGTATRRAITGKRGK
jgi:hypothetical protein